MPVDLRVRLGALELANPVLVAAGTFGYGLEFERRIPLHALGGVITKTLTLHPRQGHPPPRLVPTPAGMLNAVGLQNVGLEAFLRDTLPELAGARVPLIVSILGESPDELTAMCRRLDTEERVSAIELNLSCPNITRMTGSGLMVAQDPDATAMMVQAARAATAKPLIAKLSPDVTDIGVIAQAAERAGADVLSLVNTFTGMSLDADTRRSRLGSLTGGLGGPAIRPLAVYRVWQVHHAVRCPLIGLGGILHAEDAVEFFLAGASAVAMGTANFTDPAAAVNVVRGLERYLARHGIGSVRELTGAVEEGRVVGR